MSWGFVFRGETREIDDGARSAVDGSFIHLSNGWTHYEIVGSANARPVVLVHGFSVPYFIWEPTFNALATAGLRPVRYDLFGRGYSDRPRLRYDLELFVGQLLDLVDAVEADVLDVVGLSMGGLVAAAFTVQHPRRVRRLVLIDPAGAGAVPLGPLYTFAALPGVSEIILGVFGTEGMVRSVATDFFDPVHVRAFQERYRAQMEYRGFKRAILSTVRNGLLGARPDVYAELGRLQMPVMLIWGANDKTVPVEQSRTLREYVPRAVFHLIPDCGHIPHYEHPEKVNPLLLDFLGKS